MHRSRCLRVPTVCLLACALVISAPLADSAPQPLPFTQDWSDTSLITTNHDWSGVPGVVAYSGAGLASGTATDPQTITGENLASVNVLANQTNTNITNGGVAEFHLGNPVIAFQGSGSANAPNVVLSVSTSGRFDITVSYVLRDLDGNADNTTSRVALQYRVGASGPYINIPTAYVADASEGPELAGKETPVTAILPPDASDQPLVNIRIITTDAPGSDEWIGIDNISVTGSDIAQPTNPAGIGSAAPSTVAPGDSTFLTVLVTPGQNPESTGLAVVADLSSIGLGAAQPLYDDGTNGDVTAGDGTFSLEAAIPVSTGGGTYSLPVTIMDAQSRTGSTSIGLTVAAPITSATISQVYGGGGNSGATYRNDFIELFNKTTEAVVVDGWSVQYAAAAGSSWQVTPLTGSIAPGRYYLVQEAAGSGGTLDLPTPDATGTIAMAAGSGKVALVASTTPLTGTCPSSPTIVDLVGYGTANCSEGSSTAPTLSATNAGHRLGDGAIDTNDNGADFVAGAPAPRNRNGLPPLGVGSANPGAVDAGDPALITVAVTPGRFPDGTSIVVTADLSSVGGAAAQPLFDDGTNGDVTAGDLTFSFATVVTGAKGSILPITATIADEHARSSTTTFSIAIAPDPLPIHVLQGAGSTSTYEGQLVATTGIVTAVRPSSFYIQTPDGEVDADPNTSEGLLVFTGFPRPEVFSVGDLVKVTGSVTEFRQFAGSTPVTELSNPFTKVLSTGHALPAAVTLLPSYTAPDGSFEQLERFEGMRVTADITAITGTGSFSRTPAEEAEARSVSNGDFFAVITGVPRPMREPGIEQSLSLPAGSPCCVPRFDENPERIRVDSDGQSGAAKIEIVAGQTIAGLTGVLDVGSGVYTIVPDPQPWTIAGRGVAFPAPAPSSAEFTIASFNLQRFFDAADDPALDDEVILTPDAFERRLSKASLAIRDGLQTPDILGVQEVENLSALAALAARINADTVSAGGPNPQYVAYLFEGNDVGGIDVGFLVKSARVNVVDVRQEGKDALYQPPSGSPALLNDRPPVVLQAEILDPGAAAYPVTVIVNHLRSLNGIDGSDGPRVRAKRLAQAEFLAHLVQQRQTADPDERIVLVGDFNAFQFNDGYVDLIGSIKGQPTPADQVVLAGADLVDPDLVNLGDSLGRDQYSYLFDGHAQTLDHVLANAAAFGRFSRIAYARLNADFPESFRNDAGRPERLSDHDPVVAYFRLPGAPIVTLNGPATLQVELGTSFTDPGATASDEELGPLPVTVSGSVNPNVAGTYTLSYSATNGYRTTTVTRTVIVADTIAPTLTPVVALPPILLVPNKKMVTIGLLYAATDTVGTPTCSVEVASSDPVTGQGDKTSPDWHVIDPHHVQVRAEYSPHSLGRLYTITVTCRDAAGNASSNAGYVLVPKIPLLGLFF